MVAMIDVSLPYPLFDGLSGGDDTHRLSPSIHPPQARARRNPTPRANVGDRACAMFQIEFAGLQERSMHRILFRKAIAGSEPIGVLGLVVLLSGAVVNGAFATTMDEAAAQCREQLAPAVRNCVRNNVIAKRGSPEQYIPGCRNSVAPEFRACIAKLIGAAGFKQNTIDA